MNDITPISGADEPATIPLDFNGLAFNTVLTKVFQDMLKKPELDDDTDQGQSVTVANEINKPIAAAMAQGITGFGL